MKHPTRKASLALIPVAVGFVQFVVVLSSSLIAQSPQAFLEAASQASQAAVRSPKRTGTEQRAYRRAMEEADRKIAAEVQAHSELMKNLEYLTAQIGPRLTGSPQMLAASEWTRKRFREYGIDVHLETTQIAHGWTRGLETAEILSPIQKRIGIHAFGWSKGTEGNVTSQLIVLNLHKLSDFDQYKGKLRGMIVMTRKPLDLSKLDPNPKNAFDAAASLSEAQAELKLNSRKRLEFMRQLDAEQPALIVADSGRPDGLYSMTDSFPAYVPSEVPIAFLTHEDYDLLYRLGQTAPVTIQFNLQETFTGKSVPASITVGEIRGSEYPEERVIVGGHLDSWDLGQGALDNGTGAMATLEAARALRALGWKPKRTLTFILFTGEEQDGIGAEMFLHLHAKEVPKMDAALILDSGTGEVFTIALENQTQTIPLMQEIYGPLQITFMLQELSTRSFGSSDHVAFQRQGIPGYFCVQLPAHYGEAHHSQMDTFDKVIPDQINEAAALLAAWAWNVSEMPEALPHHLAEPTY